MKRILNMSFLAVLALAGCNDDYIDQFDVKEDFSKVQAQNYVLAPGDYATIANNAKNKAIALAKDPEGQSFANALKRLAKDCFFTDSCLAEDYLPAFIESKFFDNDLGSKFSITYNKERSESAYMADFVNMTDMTLDADAYASVWTNGIKANYLTPATEGKIPALLAAAKPEAQTGEIVVLNYAYSALEPAVSEGGSASQVPSFELVNEFSGAGRYVIASNVAGAWYAWGRLENPDKSYGNMASEPIEAEDNVLKNVEDYTVTVEGDGNAVKLKTSDGKYVYMKGTYTNFNVGDDASVEGSDWTFVFAEDGSMSLKNLLTGKAVAYTSKGFVSNVLYENSLKVDKGLTIKNVMLGEGFPEGKNVMFFDTKNGYLKASSYISSVNYPCETWAVTDPIDLASAYSPVLSMDIAARYFVESASEAFSIMVSEDYAGDIAAATWTPLSVENWSDGTSWTFVPTGDLDLKPFKGKKITIGMKYVCNEKAATIEVKNMLLVDKIKDVVEHQTVLNLFKEVGANKSLKAASAANKTVAYRFDGNAWSVYKSQAAKVAVVQPESYALVGADYISNVASFASLYLPGVYPFAEEDEYVVLIYKSGKDKVVAKEYTFAGGAWGDVKNYVAESTSFVMDNDGISAKMSVYFDAPLTDGDNGGFSIQDVNLNGLNYVWSSTATYGWKATSYMGSKNYASESWIVSPAVNLLKAEQPYVTFEEAHRYVVDGKTPADYFKVLVSAKYTGDVQTTEWTDITSSVETWSPGENWDYYNVGKISIAELAGEKAVVVAFKYTGYDDTAATFEVKNFKIGEATAE